MGLAHTFISYLGNASRECLRNDTWDLPIVIGCRTIEQMSREEKARELLSFNFSVNQTNVPYIVASIANELQQFTSTVQSLLPSDASSSANTLDALIT